MVSKETDFNNYIEKYLEPVWFWKVGYGNK